MMRCVATDIVRQGVAVLALLLTLPFAVAGAQGPTAASVTDPTVRAGDVLRVTVWRLPEFSGEIAVTADGTLEHPLYQEVQVAGAPLSVVKDRLREFLTRYELDPRLVIELLLPVTVAGEVRSPSLYPLPRGTTLGQAVALAGGPTERGRLDRVRLLRGQQELRIDLTDQASSRPIMAVQSGDQVFVGRRSQFNFLRDVFMPLLSLTAATAAIINVATR